MSDYLERLLTNSFNDISDMFGRKESRDSLFFEAIKNMFSNPFTGQQQYGVIIQIDGAEPNGTTQQVQGGAGNPTHPWVIKARIRPLGDTATNLFNEELCKYKNNKSALINYIHTSCKVAYSETIDGDESSFIPTIGDVVPIFYDIESPSTNGKERGLRFKLQRVRRAQGGMDIACIEALGGPTNGNLGLSRIGAAGGVLGSGAEFGGGFGGPGQLPTDLAIQWPSGIIGVTGPKRNLKPEEQPSKKAIGAALARRDWWIKNSGGDINNIVVRGNANGSRSIKVKKPNIITIVDATLPRNKKNLWTFDCTDRNNLKPLVYAFSGIGYSSFGPGPNDGSNGGNKSGPAIDYANGNSHTSAGMKVFGGIRGYKKETQAKGAIAIYGIEPWNSHETNRGAIGHEVNSPSVKFAKTLKARFNSAGCISTAHGVNYTAREIWKGGSWVYVYTGAPGDREDAMSNNYWVNIPGNKSYLKEEKRKTWDFNQKDGGHSKNS